MEALSRASSRHWKNAPALVPHAKANRSMSFFGLFGVPLPISPVWDLRQTCISIPAGNGRRIVGSPADTGGSRIRSRGSQRRMSPWDIHRNERGHAERACKAGSIISSAFTVWQESEEGRKGRFVMHLAKQSKYWSKCSVRMDSVAEFALSVQKGDQFFSMDIEKGYRHFRLSPLMRETGLSSSTAESTISA